MTLYFAYGTTQQGFSHHRELGLPERVRRGKLAQSNGIVVPRDPACSNPACRYLHRMAVLVPNQWNLHAEGDVFEVDEAQLQRLDALELGGPYERAEVELDGGGTAVAYTAKEPFRWYELVSAGLADAVEVYEHQDERLKPCCQAEPDHEPPHDVIDPLDPERLAVKRLRTTVQGFLAAPHSANLHILEATAATTPGRFAIYVHSAMIDWRHDQGIDENTGDRDDLARRMQAVVDQFSPS
jgi:Gamma-glutamyl cyclotransferase, AIG2-like